MPIAFHEENGIFNDYSTAFDMKTVITLIFSLLVFPCIAQNQIAITDFQQKVRLNTTELKGANLINVTTSCQGGVDVTFEDKKFSGGCAGTIERTYTITDKCDNSKTAVQYITLEDTTPPVFQTTPEDITIESRTDLKNPVSLVAFDESGNDAMVTFEESYDMNDRDFVHVTRVWTATDPCDNVATHQRVISIPRNKPTAQDED